MQSQDDRWEQHMELCGLNKVCSRYLLRDLYVLGSLGSDTINRLGILVNECPVELRLKVLTILEHAARISEKSDPNALSAAHLLLGRHCAVQNLTSDHLTIYMKPSLQYPVSNALPEITLNNELLIQKEEVLKFNESLKKEVAVANYFCDLTSIRVREHMWHEASICAALVLCITPMPQLAHVRIWTLLELIAHGHSPNVSSLKKIQIRKQKLPICSIISSLSKFFERPQWSNWVHLKTFIDMHKSSFKQWNLDDLIGEVLVSYALILIKKSMQHLTHAPLRFFTDKLDFSEALILSLDLTHTCLVKNTNGEYILESLPPQSHKEYKHASSLLDLTTEFYQRA